MITPRQLKTAVMSPGHTYEIATKKIRRAVLRAVRPNDGVYVMDEDWDNLIVIDACRYDVFAEVNTIPGTLSRRRTRGTNTGQFIRENFDGRECFDTVYVSGNSAVGAYREYIQIHDLMPVWESDSSVADQDDRPAATHLRTVASVARDAVDEYPQKRLVVHFLQPHCPYLVKDGEPLSPDSPYRYLDEAVEEGMSDRELRDLYRENVELVLESVADLVEDLSGKTVVTADHGELLGEPVGLFFKMVHPRSNFYTGGEHYEYGHESHLRVPELVEIPWLEVEDDGQRRTIRSDPPTARTEIDDKAVEKQLELLGYR